MDTTATRQVLFGIQLTLVGILIAIVRSDGPAAFLFGVVGLTISALATLRR